MIEQNLLANDLIKMTDLEELNGAFYEIDAQGVLDIWESMTSEACELNGNFGFQTLSNTNGSTNINNNTINTSTAATASTAPPFNNVWNNYIRASTAGVSAPTVSVSQATPVLKDKLLTDSIINGEFPTMGAATVDNNYSYGIKTENFNGAASDGDSTPESPLSLQDDMETECYPCIPMQSATSQVDDANVLDDDQANDASQFTMAGVRTRNRVNMLKRPAIPSPSTSATSTMNTSRATISTASKLPLVRQTVRITRPKHPQSILKHHPVLLMTAPLSGNQSSHSLQKSATLTKPAHGAKLITQATGTKEPSQQPEMIWTPVSSPSSSCSSSSAGSKAQINRAPIHTALISTQPNDACGELILTDEEKKTLISEGYPIPTKLPLTKAEERSLKKIRRKIKNKISAQESRRKKKEFVDTLERRVEEATSELVLYKKRCEMLAKQKAALAEQVKNLKSLLDKQQHANHSHHKVNLKVEPLEETEEAIQNDIDLD